MSDGYSGHVEPGGPSQVRELDRLTIRKASVSAMDNDVYLLTCRATGAQLLVDAADDAPRLRRLAAEGTGRLDVVVTTHRHWDHHRALAELVRPVLPGAEGPAGMGSEDGLTTAAGDADADELPVRPDMRLRHGDEVRFGQLTLSVVHLRGHTPGSVALVYTEPAGRAHIWTGDSLFPGGVGKTPDGGAFQSLLDDVEQRVFGVYGDDTWVYPGHGDDTTLGAERPHLAEWRARGW